MTNLRAAVFWALALLFPGAMAQQSPGRWHVDSPEKIAPGETITLAIVFDVNAPWQMYAPSPINEALRVTGLGVALDPKDGFVVSQAAYPRPINQGRYEVYEGPQVSARIKMKADPGLEQGTYNLKGYVQYQFCKPSFCLPPHRDIVTIVIEIE